MNKEFENAVLSVDLKPEDLKSLLQLRVDQEFQSTLPTGVYLSKSRSKKIRDQIVDLCFKLFDHYHKELSELRVSNVSQKDRSNSRFLLKINDKVYFDFTN